MTDTRAAFEAWWGQPPQELIQCAQPDEALSMWVWQAWQAGVAAEREAIAQLFPQPHQEYFGCDIQEAIRARGADTPAQGEAV